MRPLDHKWRQLERWSHNLVRWVGTWAGTAAFKGVESVRRAVGADVGGWELLPRYFSSQCRCLWVAVVLGDKRTQGGYEPVCPSDTDLHTVGVNACERNTRVAQRKRPPLPLVLLLRRFGAWPLPAQASGSLASESLAVKML